MIRVFLLMLAYAAYGQTFYPVVEGKTLDISRMVFVSRAIGDSASNAVRLTKGGKVSLSWLAPADTNVVRYRLYTTSATGKTDSVAIDEWFTSSIDAARSNVIVETPVSVGPGWFEMVAINRWNIMSKRSNKVFYVAEYPEPGAPLIVEVKLL